jgi:hypothetical protein
VVVLKEECEQERNALEVIAVKQDILMRKKDEFEQAKLIATKADKERKNYRKTLEEYKKKIILLNEFIVKNKKPKARLDDSLELSLDLSQSFDRT